MTAPDLIEDRLRRAFSAMAEEPIRSIAPDNEPQWSKSVPPSRRRLPLLVGAIAVVVIIGFALALVYGPRSSGPLVSHPPSPATHAPRDGRAEFRVVFAPASHATPAVLRQVASILTNRLSSLGASGVIASVVGHDVDIQGQASEGAVGTDLIVVAATEVVSLRPVECGAPPYDAAVGVVAPATKSPLAACGASYETNEANLAVTPDPSVPAGYTERTVPADPAFTSYRSTTPSVADADSSGTVLLPTAPWAGDVGYPRYVLGPSELNGSDITGARAVKVGGHWSVAISLTPTATTQWTAFVDENFHQMISIDLDGAVLAAPLIQPEQAAVASLDGEFRLSGTYTARQARRLASVFGREALPVVLVRQSQTIVGAGLRHGRSG